MSERWQEYFEGQGAFGSGWLKAAVAHWGFHEVLYGTIQRYLPPSSRLLDIGCGPGWSDIYLSSLGYEVTGLDADERLVSHARSLNKVLGERAEFQQANAFDLSEYYGRFDLSYSCGVLEHFERDTTIRLLREQAKCSRYVLIQVPTAYTRYTGEITDERIYSVRELRGIVRDADLDIVLSFGYGDITATRTAIWLRRLLPRGIWRWAQNMGYAYGIAVLGMRK